MRARLNPKLPSIPALSSARLSNRVRAIAAGLSPAELRAVLRGDPPTERPNPRFLAHTLSFLLHLRPRTYPAASTWFTHTFRLGFFTTFLFFVELFTGLILMVYYLPTPAGAYESILKLVSGVPFGAMMRNMHRLAGEGMLGFALLHMLRTYVTGSYKQGRSFTWLTGVSLLFLTLALSFSGYLLPWDQLAYWAVTIGTSMAEAIPFIGPQVNLLLRGAAEIGADGLLRFYLLHVVLLPLLTILVLSVHYYRVSRVHGLSLPAAIEETDLPPAVRQAATRPIEFIPDLLTHELFLICLGLFSLVIAILFFYHAPLQPHADPGQTPLNTEAPWFFLWVQGLLKLGDKTVMGVIVPVAFFALLAAVPYLDRNPSRLMRRRPLALLGGAIVVAALVGLSYMGTHYYGIELPPATRIGQTIAPEEGGGPLQTMPYEQLAAGVYPLNHTDSGSLPPELGRVFGQLEQQVNKATAQGDFTDADAVMVVEEWQADLKRITLRLTWSDSTGGERKNYERIVYRHRADLAD
jgi:quinol-cytochrome oxidoreductase complex cytochrome b subunit